VKLHNKKDFHTEIKTPSTKCFALQSTYVKAKIL